MSNEINTMTETIGNEDKNTSIAISNERIETTTNGVFHSNENNQIEQQQQPIHSTRNTYDNNEQQIYNKNDLEPESLRKVFIGGLSYKTDDQTFKDYFSKYGDIIVSRNIIDH